MNDNRVQLRCNTCGGIMMVDEGRSILSCPYCGSQELIIDSDTVAVERVRGEAQLRLERQRMEYAEKIAAAQELKNRSKSFRKSFFGRLLFFLSIVCAIVSIVNFQQSHIWLGILAVVQASLFFSAWLLGAQIIKGAPHAYIAPAIIGFILIPVFLSSSNNAREAHEAATREVERSVTYVWPNTPLGQKLPKPESETGKVIWSSDTSFSIDIYHCSESQYSSYVAACKDRGFTVESESSSSRYEAYDEDGYKLRVSYYSSSEEMDIHLDAPRALHEISWPKSDLVSLLPVPPSLRGEIIVDNATSFAVYIGDMDKEQYATYVDDCWDAGFSLDHSRSEETFSAENSSGYNLLVRYEGAKVIYISIDAPAAEQPSPEPEEDPVTREADEPRESPQPSQEASDPSLVTPEFKELMDSYEKFMDSYIEFMKKYDKNPNDPSLLLQYSDIMSEFMDYSNKLDAIDEKTLSPADDAYYLAVLMRVEQKLLDYNASRG